MKRLMILLVLLPLLSNAQDRQEPAKHDTSESFLDATAKGAFVSGVVYFSMNSLNKGEDKWLSRGISMVAAMVFEMYSHPTGQDPQIGASALGSLGTMTISVAIPVFTGKRKHNKYCKYN